MNTFQHNIKLTLAYDGSPYLGWQKTPTGPSIEGILQSTLEQILQEKVLLQAASRTDAGVHAHAQIVNFFTSQKNINIAKLQISLNKMLPSSLAILSIENMPYAFHPTLDCIKKEYHYYICNGIAQMPQHRLYSWHYPYPLNVHDIRSAAQYLLGKRDFSALCNVKKNNHYKNYIRHLLRIDVIELPGKRIRIEIEGNNFLYKMVRNSVGTLVYIGRGKLQVRDLLQILDNGDRTKAGMTAPAHGLALHQVYY